MYAPATACVSSAGWRRSMAALIRGMWELWWRAEFHAALKLADEGWRCSFCSMAQLKKKKKKSKSLTLVLIQKQQQLYRRHVGWNCDTRSWMEIILQRSSQMMAWGVARHCRVTEWLVKKIYSNNRTWKGRWRGGIISTRWFRKRSR